MRFRGSFKSVFLVTVSGMYLLSLILWMIRRDGNPEIVTWSGDSPFVQAGPRFSDFFQVFDGVKYEMPFKYDAVTYPPSTLLLLSMFSFLKSDPIVKREAKRKKLIEEAMHIQRSGDLKLFAVKMDTIDKLEKEIDVLQSAKQ